MDRYVSCNRWYLILGVVLSTFLPPASVSLSQQTANTGSAVPDPDPANTSSRRVQRTNGQRLPHNARFMSAGSVQPAFAMESTPSDAAIANPVRNAVAKEPADAAQVGRGSRTSLVLPVQDGADSGFEDLPSIRIRRAESSPVNPQNQNRPSWIGGFDNESFEDYNDFSYRQSRANDSSGPKTSGRIQFRYSYLNDSGPFDNPIQNDFEMERVRIGFRGQLFDSFFRYNIGTDLDTDGAGGSAEVVSLLNAYLDIDLQESVGIGFGDRTMLRLGYWRTNFGRQTAESSRRLQFVDRTLTSSVFNLGTNSGIGILGRYTWLYRPVNYELALLNGFGTSGNGVRDGLDNQLGFAFRTTRDVWDNFEAGEPDLGFGYQPSWRIGMSLGFTRRFRRGASGASDEFDDAPAVLLVSDVSSGNPFFAMDQLRGSEREYDLWLAGVESSYKSLGWSFHTEYLMRFINNVRFVSDDTFRDFTHGFYGQCGYMLTEKVELVFRHSSVFAHGTGSGSPVRADYRTTSNESSAGMNFYFRGHDAKFQFDITAVDGAPISASSLNLLAGDKGVLFRAQYQISF